MLEALRSRGAAFAPSADALSVVTMPQEGREGPTANAIYFWHDYPMEGLKLAPGWRDAAPAVADKYRYLWDRFQAGLLDADTPKRLVLSNTQNNLVEFGTPQTMQGLFGLDAGFFGELTGVLDGLGVRNYSLVFLNRNIADTVETRARINDPRFSTRFGGAMLLPTLPAFAASALGPARGDGRWRRRAVGRYPGGWSIAPSEPGAAIVWKDDGAGPYPVGELWEAEDGLLGVFAQAPNQLVKVVCEDGGLRFSSICGGPKAFWPRLGD